MTKWWRAAGSLRRVTELPKFRSYHTIQAVPREYSGHRVAVRERVQGRIPTVVFSQKYVEKKTGDPNSVAADSSISRKLLLTTEKKQIKAVLKDVEPAFFCSTTFPLQVRAGSGSSSLIESGRVLPMKVQRNEETGEILNLVFVWAEDGKEILVDVPLVFKGEDACPGIQKGGCLNKVRKTLRYLCPAEHIPPKIEVDISNLDIGDKLQLEDIKVHPSLKLISKNNVMPVCKIMAMNIPESESSAEKPTLGSDQ